MIDASLRIFLKKKAFGSQSSLSYTYMNRSQLNPKKFKNIFRQFLSIQRFSISSFAEAVHDQIAYLSRAPRLSDPSYLNNESH